MEDVICRSCQLRRWDKRFTSLCSGITLLKLLLSSCGNDLFRLVKNFELSNWGNSGVQQQQTKRKNQSVTTADTADVQMHDVMCLLDH